MSRQVPVSYLEDNSNERYWDLWFQHLLQGREDNRLNQTQLLAIRDTLTNPASGLALYTPESIRRHHASEEREPRARIQGIAKNLDSISSFLKRLDEKLVPREYYADTRM
jgi:hypothetical protein